MKIEKGMLLRVQTTTKMDVFGECLYEVTEVGLQAPEPNRKAEMDGVKCVMLGGSGPSAREGFSVIDSEAAINRNMTTGITQVVEAAKRAEIMAYYKDKTNDGTKRTIGASGCMEVD